MFLLNILLAFILNHNFSFMKNKYKFKPNIYLYNGYDERFIGENITNKLIKYNEDIKKIKINFKNKIILDKLSSNDISIIDKLKLINYNNLMVVPPNLTAGGLKYDTFI